MEKEITLEEKKRAEILFMVLKEFYSKDISLQRAVDITKFYRLVQEILSGISKCSNCGNEQTIYETRKKQ